MVEYVVSPVESTVDRISNRVHIMQGGAEGAEGAGGAGEVKFDYYKKHYVPSALRGPASHRPLSPNSQLLSQNSGLRISDLSRRPNTP